MLEGMNWHIASASVLAISMFCWPITEPCCATIFWITDNWVSASRPLYSLHVMVSEFDGGGTLDDVRGVEGRPGMLGRPGMPGKVGMVGCDVERGVERLAPGSVVIATVPGVVLGLGDLPVA